MNAGDIAKAWALACCETLEKRDLEGHMDLISKKVQVFGLADLDVVNYNFWLKQVQEQFAAGTVTSLSYYLNSVKAESDSLIKFTAMEYLTDNKGEKYENPLLIVLAKEDDGVWRAIEEKILDRDEADAAGLIKLQ
jgi:hypothetical protein